MRRLLSRLILWAIEPELNERDVRVARVAVEVASGNIGKHVAIGRQPQVTTNYPRGY